MSGVAMLKVRGAKRVFDEMAIDLPVTSNSCSPARFPLRPLKRGRCNPAQPSPAKPSPTPSPSSSLVPTPCRTTAVVSPQRAVAAAVAASAQSAHAGPHASPASQAAAQSGADGPTSSQQQPQHQLQRLSAEELATLARHVPKRLKRVVERMSAGQVSTVEKVFTVNDLREIISSVLAEREASLSEEFAKILHERLAEQFRDFTKFNEDYVARQLRGRDFAYLS